MMKRNVWTIAAGLGLALVVAPLAAHHSFAGTYLEDAEPVQIEGKMVEFAVRNPHSFVFVEDAKLKGKDGKPVRWSIEWGAAGQLQQQGVRAGTLKVGDQVTVTGSPGRDPEAHRLRMRTITRPSDGWRWPVGNQSFN